MPATQRVRTEPCVSSSVSEESNILFGEFRRFSALLGVGLRELSVCKLMNKGTTNSSCCFGCRTEEGIGLNVIAPLTVELEGHRNIEGEADGTLSTFTSIRVELVVAVGCGLDSADKREDATCFC